MTHFTYIGTELGLFAKATRWKSYWAKQVRPFWRGDVLEVGAGIGSNFGALVGPEVCRWVCLEPDPALASQIRPSGSVHVEVIVGGIRDLPREPLYDAILYADVLEHIEDDRGEVEEAALRLQPGGVLIVLAPAHNFLFSEFDNAIGHYRRYDRRSLLELHPPGTRVRLVRYLDAAGMCLSLGNRLLLKKDLPTESQIRIWDRLVVPVSEYLDPLLGYRAGKSVLCVWQKNSEE